MYESLPSLVEIKSNRHLELYGRELRSIFNPPATEIEIADCERHLGLELPQSFRHFLKAYNGAEILLDEEYDVGLYILSTKEIPELTLSAREMIEDLSEEEQFPLIQFTFLGSSADFYGFLVKDLENNEYPVIECLHDENPLEWRQVSTSFDEWLKQLLGVYGGFD